LIWIVYFALGLCLIYSLYYTASYFGVTFFTLSNRGMLAHAVSDNIISNVWDKAIWSGSIFISLAWLFYAVSINLKSTFHRLLAIVVLRALCIWVCLVVFGVISPVFLSFACVLVFVLCYKIFPHAIYSRLNFFLYVFFCITIIAMVFEFTIFAFVSVPNTLNFSLNPQSLHLSNLGLNFFNLTYPILPYEYLLFVFLGIAAFFVKFQSSKLLNFRRVRVFLGILSTKLRSSSKMNSDFLDGRFTLVLVVVFSVVVSCLFVVLTVLPWTNPTNMLVSADSPIYYRLIVYMRSVSVNGALSFAFANDRALFLILSYALSFAIPPEYVVQFCAALLIGLFTIASLLILKMVSKDKTLQILGILLVPFSFQALGLIYSGYFANMLALILVFVYIILFFRFRGSWLSMHFFALLGISILILFSHSWTWFIFSLSLVLFLFLEWNSARQNKERYWSRFKTEAIFIGATIEVGFVCDLFRKLLSPVSSTGSVIATAQSSLGFPNPAYTVRGLTDTINFVLGGVYANPVLILLSLAGFLVLLMKKKRISNFLVSWNFVACALIFFSAESFVFDRLLFLITWIPLSGLGLYAIVSVINSYLDGFKRGRMVIVGLVLSGVFFTLANYSLSYILNINIF
jgi:hypothetical protein